MLPPTANNSNSDEQWKRPVTSIINCNRQLPTTSTSGHRRLRSGRCQQWTSSNRWQPQTATVNDHVWLEPVTTTKQQQWQASATGDKSEYLHRQWPDRLRHRPTGVTSDSSDHDGYRQRKRPLTATHSDSEQWQAMTGDYHHKGQRVISTNNDCNRWRQPATTNNCRVNSMSI